MDVVNDIDLAKPGEDAPNGEEPFASGVFDETNPVMPEPVGEPIPVPMFRDLARTAKLNSEEKVAELERIWHEQGSDFKREDLVAFAGALIEVKGLVEADKQKDRLIDLTRRLDDLGRKAAPDAARFVADYTSYDAATLCGAFSRLHAADKAFFDALKPAIMRGKFDFRPTNISYLLSSYARASVSDQEVFAELTEVIVGRRMLFEPYHIGHTLRSLARLGEIDEGNTAAQALLPVMIAKRERCENAGALTNVLWSLSILNESLAREAWSQLAADIPHLTPRAADIIRLYQSALAVRFPVPPDLSSEALRFLAHRQREDSRAVNSFEHSVGEVLSSLGLKEVHSQHFVCGFFIDFVVRIAERTVALECDGVQYHFANADPQGNRFGNDLLAEKLLRMHGYDIVRISSHEWDAAPDRQFFLANKLWLMDC